MQVPEQNQFQKRQVAIKTSISSILKWNFTKDNITGSRVSVMATLVYKSEDVYSGAIIDDGSGRVSLKNFENRIIFTNVDVGDVVLVIGRVREFSNERYILPEIVKKISMEWINVRKLELNGLEDDKVADPPDNGKDEEIGLGKDVYEMIKKLDDGNGVAIEDLIKNSYFQDTERIINKLLENGDVFEIKPGKIKVLE
ncbi:hypothetical protein HYX07_03260 [Candidatus Woesearchaeota archaeon]|nr:hypothetical protein [Candidatus Woesearchaeota archaeon]